MKREEVRKLCTDYNSMMYKRCLKDRAFYDFKTKTISISDKILPFKKAIPLISTILRRCA